MIDPEDFLAAVRGPRESSRVVRLGTVDPNHTSGDPQVQWDGEDAVSTKSYPTVGYTPVAGDRVAAIPAGRSWLIIGKVGSGDLVGHDHDARYVNTDGDTMAGTLAFNKALSSANVLLDLMQGYLAFSDNAGPGTANNRLWMGGPNGGAVYFSTRSGSENLALIRLRAALVEVVGDFTTTGTKNAQIADPDDPARAYRFAAVESDEPGLLMRRMTVDVPARGEVTVDLPAQWAKIAREADAMVAPLDATQQDGRVWPRASVDLAAPNVIVRALPGSYRVWLIACRADPGVDGWTHEVDVPAEPEPDEPQPGL